MVDTDGEMNQLAKSYRRNVSRAVKILKEAGCAAVFVFGSVASGRIEDDSDIDLAIRGCPKGGFFHLMGRLLLELDYPVDLVNLDRRDAFACYLEREGELLQVG